MSLKDDIQLVVSNKRILNIFAKKYHYLHQPIPDIAIPFGWIISYKDKLWQPDGLPSGFIMFATVHFTKLKGEFGYFGLPTKWQVLNLSRVWLHDNLPHNSETCTIAKALKLVQRRWLDVHPPCFPEEPYHILKIISFCDTSIHNGTIYKASNFREIGKTKSRTRHGGNRGKGSNGNTLVRYIYDLKKPNWAYKPKQANFLSDL